MEKLINSTMNIFISKMDNKMKWQKRIELENKIKKSYPLLFKQQTAIDSDWIIRGKVFCKDCQCFIDFDFFQLVKCPCNKKGVKSG